MSEPASQGRRFTRRVESFTCAHCGCHVEGTGYTNHCPECLWSRHVDVNPGDRQADCGGMMEPIRIELRKGVHYILHRCRKCGCSKWNKASPDDNFETLLKISAGDIRN